MEQGDTDTLDKFSVVGEGRWGSLVRKPFIAFNGSTESDVDTISTVPEARKTDRINVTLPAPGSEELAFVICARMVSRIAVIANDNPPTDYGSQPASGLVPGPDGDQWTYVQRDLLVKRGVSTSEVKDGVVNLADTVTYYHPDGDPTPAYRFVVDIIKLQNIIFNLDLIFAVPAWDGAPLIPDTQRTSNKNAKQPKMAVAAVNSLIDNLGLEAILSDPATAKESTIAGINASNPKRLDLALTVQLSGNSNIISVDLNFGFFFGTTPLVA
jgi:phage tail sheath gpL-like